MKGPTRMAGEPVSYFGMLADGVIVEDRVDQFAGRHGGFDSVQKTTEFLVTVARHALPHDRTVENVERREQTSIGRGGAGGAMVGRQSIAPISSPNCAGVSVNVPSTVGAILVESNITLTERTNAAR